MSEATGHSESDRLPDGTNNNQAESFNWRMRRAAEGIYLSPSNKYLADYAVEAAWREDARHLSTGQKLRAPARGDGRGAFTLVARLPPGAASHLRDAGGGTPGGSGRGKRKGAKPKVPW